jgi:hypothetical protein
MDFVPSKDVVKAAWSGDSDDDGDFGCFIGTLRY